VPLGTGGGRKKSATAIRSQLSGEQAGGGAPQTPRPFSGTIYAPKKVVCLITGCPSPIAARRAARRPLVDSRSSATSRSAARLGKEQKRTPRELALEAHVHRRPARGHAPRSRGARRRPAPKRSKAPPRARRILARPTVEAVVRRGRRRARRAAVLVAPRSRKSKRSLRPVYSSTCATNSETQTRTVDAIAASSPGARSTRKGLRRGCSATALLSRIRSLNKNDQSLTCVHLRSCTGHSASAPRPPYIISICRRAEDVLRVLLRAVKGGLCV